MSLHVLFKAHWFLLSSIQRGKEEYKLAATSDGGHKKGKKGKEKKNMDDLKKEVDLVSDSWCQSSSRPTFGHSNDTVKPSLLEESHVAV